LDMSRQDVTFAELLVFGSHGRHPVKVFPTIMVLDPWREMLLFSEGYIHAKELAAILNEVPRDYNPVRTQREALNSDRNNSRALTRVGELYDQSTAFGIANRYYMEALTKPGAKEDDALREDLTYRIALNEVRRADWGSARKRLLEFRAAFPQSKMMDQVLLGLVLADVRQGRTKHAEAYAAELESAHGNSEAAGAARRLLQNAKTERH